MAERLRFDRGLYASEAVRDAAEAFGHLGRLTLHELDDAVVLELCEPDPRFADVLGDEIANHALFETIRRSRLGA